MSADRSPNYSDKGVDQLLELPETLRQLDDLMARAVEHSRLATDRAKEYFLNGVGRRLKTMRRSLENVFRLFPVAAVKPLPAEDLADAEINLHAFVMNLYGLLDNLAWVFVSHHNLLDAVGGRKRVGLFLAATTRHFADPLRTYVQSPTMTAWHHQYLKNYRDALAHRIPLYIPPAFWSDEDAAEYQRLETLEMDHFRAQEWSEREEVAAERASLGTACPVFVHSFKPEEQSRAVWLHTQMVADAKTTIEVCGVFFDHWQNRTS